jgi:hypothetical protein
LSNLSNARQVFSTADVNRILAGFILNISEPKPIAERTINLFGATGSGAPSGQGALDKATLITAGWTVTTR